jgi:hypothetical protein
LNEIYVVVYEDDAVIAFNNRTDAEEYIFATAEENFYEDCLLGHIPSEDYCWELRLGALGYGITAIPLIMEG